MVSMEGNLNPNRFHFNEFILYDFWPSFFCSGLIFLDGLAKESWQDLGSSDELMCSSCCYVVYI